MKKYEGITIHQISDFKGGWFIGDFEPSLLKTQDLEVSIKKHPKGENWDTHFHKLATEYNYLVSGKMSINGIEIKAGEIFIINPYYAVEPNFIEDCEIVCIKIPGVTEDKYVSN